MRLSGNPSIFELDRKALTDRADLYRDDLITMYMDPDRIKTILESGVPSNELHKYLG